MATLSKNTIQRLAALRAISMWTKGAYGPVRVHKTLFFADKTAGDQEWHLFTFKKWRLGQYSDEIAEALNALRESKCICTEYDGPSERIVATVGNPSRALVVRFFKVFFPEWHKALLPAFKEWAYLTSDAVIEKAHQHSSYTKKQHGEIIIESFASETVEFDGLSDRDAESLSDLVDCRLQHGLAHRIEEAAEKRIVSEDWRTIYFGKQKQSA